jgi:hypothetical protein
MVLKYELKIEKVMQMEDCLQTALETEAGYRKIQCESFSK